MPPFFIMVLADAILDRSHTINTFSIPNFLKIKEFLVTEVYNELICQLINTGKRYEDIGYSEIRDWFYGMTFDIKMINLLDQKFNEIGVRIRY